MLLQDTISLAGETPRPDMGPPPELNGNANGAYVPDSVVFLLSISFLDASSLFLSYCYSILVTRAKNILSISTHSTVLLNSTSSSISKTYSQKFLLFPQKSKPAKEEVELTRTQSLPMKVRFSNYLLLLFLLFLYEWSYAVLVTDIKWTQWQGEHLLITMY